MRNWIFLVFLATLLLSIRLIGLDADPPDSLQSASMGEYVDEGYKTLDARNIVLFGAPHWTPEDDYVGWMKRSPINHWAYVALFEIFGPNIRSARLATLAFYALFLIGFLLGPARQYSPSLAALGLIVLGSSHILFVFSRLAIHEISIVAAVYLPIFIWQRVGRKRPKISAALFLAFSIAATFGIKETSLIYIGLAGMGLLASCWISGAFEKERFKKLTVVLAGIVAAVAVLFLTWDTWSSRIHLSFWGATRSLLENPLLQSSPMIVAAGLLSVLYGALVAPKRFLGNGYRAALSVIALGGPLCLAAFPYHPLRYFVPLLPAYALLALEWLHLRLSEQEPPRKSSTTNAAVALAILTLTIASILHGLNRFLLAPIIPGVDLAPGDTGPISLSFLTALALALCGVIWSYRSVALQGVVVRLVLTALVGLSIGFGVSQDLHMLTSPSYRQRELSAQLTELIAEDETVGGDWAPWFTIGTRLQSLRVNEKFNAIPRLPDTRLDYLLYGDSGSMIGALDAVDRLPGVCLDKAILESEYLGRRVVLFPIRYERDCLSRVPG